MFWNNWTPELDDLVRQWTGEGVKRAEQARRLREMTGYKVDEMDISNRKAELGLSRPIFIWEKHPQAIAYMEKHYGYKPNPKIAEVLSEMTGYPLTRKHIENRAFTMNMSALMPDEDMTTLDASRLVGVAIPSLLATIRRYKIPRKGQGLFKFLDPKAIACLCAYYEVEPPIPPLEQFRTGQVVQASVQLRAVLSVRRPTYLFPRWRSERVHYQRHQLLGPVINKGSGFIEVQTRYGAVRVAPSLIQLHVPAEVCLAA